MPLVNHSQREIHIKIVYYGPGLGGKTTNLERIHAKTREDRRGKLISLSNTSERTLFFDLLPMDLGDFRGYSVRLHLCTVPGQIAFDRTRKVILRHVDGVVFVVDSQPSRLGDNLESIDNLYENLEALNVDADRLPLVVQYNKRDIPGVVPVAELRRVLEVPRSVPQVEASALHGRGVFATLKAITKACLRLVGDPALRSEGRSPSVLPRARGTMRPSGNINDRVDTVPPPAEVPSELKKS